MQSIVSPVSGLQYFQGYITQEQHDWLLARVDEQSWSDELRRRVQHYGYRYDYKARSVDPSSMYLGPLPNWITPFIQKKLFKDNLVEQAPDQLIVNEYEPGQGISPHIDCVPCFAETIISLSLGSSALMVFSHGSTGEQVSLLLEPRSLLIMKGEARYQWKHSIPGRKTDIHQGEIIERRRRVSLTFRNVIK